MHRASANDASQSSLGAAAAGEDSRSFDLLDKCLEKLQRGEALNRQSLLEQHPDLAGAIECLERLDAFAAPISHDGLLPGGSSAAEASALTVDSRDRAKPRSASADGFAARGPDWSRSEFGQYEILEEIGRGGMGVVFKARQKGLDRFVALKMISGVSIAGDRLRRFHTEAKAAAALTHPHVVGIYEVGQAFGHHYLAMEFVAGRSLADRLKQGKLPVEEAAEILCSVAYAVHHLHEQDVVHRDLKPSNILLDEQGKPHVTDFGLAKVFSDEGDLTATGVIAGTPPYMSPEQASGQTERVGPLSDVYSLGAILYEMLSGRPPFREKNPLETLMAVREREPTPLRLLPGKVPPELEIICLKCLEKSPGERYPSARALAQDIERFLRREAIEAQPPSRLQRLTRWARRKPALATRLMGIAVFHVVQWFNYASGVVDFSFHWKASAVLCAWVLLSFLFQRVLDEERQARIARYAWGLTDVSCLMVILLLADGLASPLIVCLPLLVVASGLWFEERLVGFVTLATCGAYLVLVADYFARGGEAVTMIRPGADRHIYYLLALTITGGIVAYQVSRVRALNRYLEKSRLR